MMYWKRYLRETISRVRRFRRSEIELRMTLHSVEAQCGDRRWVERQERKASFQEV